MDLPTELNFTPEGKAAYEEFKQRMLAQFGNVAKDDYGLYRFLRARDFNIGKAEIMFKKHVEWRKKMKLLPILEDYEMCEVHKKYVNFSVLCYDKMRYPVTYVDGGNIDLKGVVSSETAFTCKKGLARVLTALETVMKEESAKLGYPVDQWSIIINFKNLSMAQAANKSVIEFLFDVFSTYDANYPERLKTAFLINTNSVSYYLVNLLKPLLAVRTANKLKIFGKEEGWKEELLNLVDAEVLPTFLGGKKTEPEGKLPRPERIRLNGPVPRKYYFRSPEMRLCGKPGIKEYFLKKMEKMEILLEIDEPGSSIEWEFETETGCIAFGLFRRNNVENNNGEELEPIIPIRKVNAGAQIEKDNFICETDGVYVFVLDNTFSWFRDKQVFCKTYVKKFSERKTTDPILERIRSILENTT